MAATFSNFKQKFSSAPRYQRFLSYALVAYLMYALLLGLLVPYLAKSMAPEKISALLGRPVQIQDVAINPFTLKFEIKGFEIQTQEQQDFVGIGRLTLQINLWKSLFNGSINLETIEVDQAFANIERLDATQFNFSDIPAYIAAQAVPSATPEPIIEDTNESSELPHIQIANMSITNTKFNFKDQPTGAVLNYPAINIRLTKFNSLAKLVNPKQPNTPRPSYNSFNLSIEGADDSAVTTEGRFQLSPLEAQGKLALKHIKLTTFWPFIADQLTAKLESGVIDFATDYQFISTDDAPQLLTNSGQFSLRTLTFTTKDKAIINLPLLTVAGIKVDLLQQKIGLDNISTDGLQVNAQINKDGAVDLAAAFSPKQAITDNNQSDTTEAKNSDVQVTENAEQPAWLVTLGEFNLTNYDINVTESMLTNATKWRVFPINVHTKSLTSRLETPIEYDLALTINDKGTFSSQGSVDVKEQALDATINLSKLNLAQFQPYLNPYVNITIKGGEFSTQGKIYANAKGAMRFNGGITLEALAINDKKLNKTLIKWQDFSINNLKFDQEKNSLLIDHISLTQPYAQVIMAADKSSNVSGLIVETKTTNKATAAAPKKTPQVTTAAKDAMLIEINKITLAQGQVDYTDNLLKPTFEATIEKLQGQVGKVSSTATKNAELNIKGIVNKYAPITLRGEINPLIQQPYVDIEFIFDNFELPSMTPYSGTYAGLDIDEGQLSLALKYKLEKGHLEGSNHIFIDQLDMNDTKDSDVGSIIPITLAIPLLKDSSGAIDLGINVSGDVNDPSFNVGEIVLKSLSNIILKAVTSPFTLLASLVDTTEDLDKVSFANGSTTLAQTEQSKLDSLAKALAQRPQIKLNIKGSYDANTDKIALQNSALNSKLSQSTGRLIEPNINAADLPVSAGMTNALIALYELETKGKADALRDAIATQQPALAAPELEQVWLRSLYTEARKLQVVTEQQLRGLAKSRANTIKSHLRDVSKVDAGRIFILSHQSNVPSTSTETTLTLVVK
ncbi:DUF748 domain-containing protein [Moritella sp.]|uniref:DUF748 domain-containing protein n=1 Tax=Moritella sp. TaxID=78556 RepID=UPI001D44FD60|nr:DUF748 domain-containing protein [Moritella sp.]MCJ8350588.1 DUF748 domain-containing protein [Moritella sp.]NQZ41957.1 DUF748 domain-containing protein [Moritella sp.]